MRAEEEEGEGGNGEGVEDGLGEVMEARELASESIYNVE